MPSSDRNSLLPADAPSPVSPLMMQYWAIKRRHPDCLLFYRMGDFYELFFDDAVKAAAALDIALTKRGKYEGEDIAMAGVPVHSHETYVARLIRHGFKVAVCEQTEDPAAARRRGAKAVVARDVVRVITAGTLTEDTLLDARRPNYLLAVAETGGEIGIAWLDISTGDLLTQPVARRDLAAALARLEPGELLVADALLQGDTFVQVAADWRERTTRLPPNSFDPAAASRRLRGVFRVDSLDAFGDFSPAEVAAAGALVDYVNLTQTGKLPRLTPPRRLPRGAVMEIDVATRRNLEITRTMGGERKGSLIASIDQTVTGAGARLLLERLCAPSTDPAIIDRRLDIVQVFVEDEEWRASVRAILKRCPDLERPLARLSLGRGGPRDLAAVRDALVRTAELRRVAVAAGFGGVPLPALAEVIAQLGEHASLVEALGGALAPELPLMARDGGFVAVGYHAELDELRQLRDDSRKLIADLEARYVSATGIQSLKIRHNNVLGYFVEVAAKHADRLPAGPASPFILRQAMVGAQRYATVELADFESRIARAADQALALELVVFEDLVKLVVGSGARHRPGGARPCRARSCRGAGRACGDAAVDAPDHRGVGGLRHRGRPPPGGRGSDGRTCRGCLRRQRPCRSTASSGSACSPDRTWPARAPFCGRTRSSPSWRNRDVTSRPTRPGSASSIGCSRGSVPPTISPAAARPSWSRWWRRRPSSIRPASVRWSSSTRSAAAPPPSTASRSPGRWSSICTRSTAAAPCSPPTTTS